jgi:hypothetical protein
VAVHIVPALDQLPLLLYANAIRWYAPVACTSHYDVPTACRSTRCSRGDVPFHPYNHRCIYYSIGERYALPCSTTEGDPLLPDGTPVTPSSCPLSLHAPATLVVRQYSLYPFIHEPYPIARPGSHAVDVRCTPAPGDSILPRWYVVTPKDTAANVCTPYYLI